VPVARCPWSTGNWCTTAGTGRSGERPRRPLARPESRRKSPPAPTGAATSAARSGPPAGRRRGLRSAASAREHVHCDAVRPQDPPHLGQRRLVVHYVLKHLIGSHDVKLGIVVWQPIRRLDRGEAGASGTSKSQPRASKPSVLQAATTPPSPQPKSRIRSSPRSGRPGSPAPRGAWLPEPRGPKPSAGGAGGRGTHEADCSVGSVSGCRPRCAWQRPRRLVMRSGLPL
jgi:hypothetical protein